MSHSIIHTLDFNSAPNRNPSFATTQALSNYSSVILARKLENHVLLSTEDPADPSKPEILFRKHETKEKKRPIINQIDRRRHTLTASQVDTKQEKTKKLKQYHSPRPKPHNKETSRPKPISAPITKRESPKEKKVSQLILEFNQLDPKIPFSRNRYVGQYSEIITQVHHRNQTIVKLRKEQQKTMKEQEMEVLKKRKEEGIKIQMANKEKYLQKQKNIQLAEQGVEINIDEDRIKEDKQLIDKMRKGQKSIYSPMCSPRIITRRKKRCMSEVKPPEIKMSILSQHEKERRAGLVKKQQIVWRNSILAEKKERIKQNYKKLQNLKMLNNQIKELNVRHSRKRKFSPKDSRKKDKKYSNSIPNNMLIDLLKPIFTKTSINCAYDENDPDRKYSKSLVSPENATNKHSPENLQVIQKNNFFNKANELRVQQHNRNSIIPLSSTVIKPADSNADIRQRNSVSLYEKENELSKNLYRLQIKQKLMEFASRLDRLMEKNKLVDAKMVLKIQVGMRGYLARKKYKELKAQQCELGNKIDIDVIEANMPKPFTKKERDLLQRKQKEMEEERDSHINILKSNKEEFSKLVDISKKCFESFQVFAQTLILQRTPNSSSNSKDTPASERDATTTDYQMKVYELAKLLAEHQITPEDHISQLEALHANYIKERKDKQKAITAADIKTPQQVVEEITYQQLQKEEEEAKKMLNDALKIDVDAEIKSKSTKLKEVIESTKIDTLQAQPPNKGKPITIVNDNSLLFGLTADKIVDGICDQLLNEIKTTQLFPPRRTGFQTDLEYVERYIEEVYIIVMQNMTIFMDSISTPINRSPLYILGQLQNQESVYFEGIDNIMSQPVLPIEWYIDIEKNRKDKIDTDATHQEDQQLSEMINIHNKCIFDALNDALDFFRPLGVHGPPLPWSTRIRELNYQLPKLDSILDGAKRKVLQWCCVNAGCILQPGLLSAADQIKLNESGLSVSYLNMIREERLVYILTSEINENEENWVDYELEETQVKFDLADMILDSLLTEATEILVNIEESRAIGS